MTKGKTRRQATTTTESDDDIKAFFTDEDYNRRPRSSSSGSGKTDESSSSKSSTSTIKGFIDPDAGLTANEIKKKYNRTTPVTESSLKTNSTKSTNFANAMKKTLEEQEKINAEWRGKYDDYIKEFNEPKKGSRNSGFSRE